MRVEANIDKLLSGTGHDEHFALEFLSVFTGFFTLMNPDFVYHSQLILEIEVKFLQSCSRFSDMV